jgi:hypothetical protein
MQQRSFFGLSEHLEQLSRNGDSLEVLETTVDFEYFRGWLVEGLGYGDGAKGGCPPFDPVSMFKALILASGRNAAAVPALIETPQKPERPRPRAPRAGRGDIELEIDGVVVRVRRGAEAKTVAAAIKALKAVW